MKKILIIHNSRTECERMRNVLSEDYEAYGAESGADALELIMNECPDVIIADIQSLYSEGIEMTEKLLLDSDVSRLPFVLLSPLLRSTYVDHCWRLLEHAPVVLCKPVGPLEIKDTLSALLIK